MRQIIRHTSSLSSLRIAKQLMVVGGEVFFGGIIPKNSVDEFHTLQVALVNLTKLHVDGHMV